MYCFHNAGVLNNLLGPGTWFYRKVFLKIIWFYLNQFSDSQSCTCRIFKNHTLKALNIPFKNVVLPGRVKCGGPEGEIVVAQGLLLFPARHKHWKCLVQGDLDTENIYITLIHTLETCMLCLSLIWTHKVHTNLDFGNFYATVIKSLKTSMSRWSRH